MTHDDWYWTQVKKYGTPPFASSYDASKAAWEAEKEQPAAPTDEPMAWVDLLNAAEKIVRSKAVWKQWIDGTPLSNDVPVWMATFAQYHAAQQPAAPALPADAAEWLRQKYGAERGHPDWRALAEAFEAGKAPPRAPLTEERIMEIVAELQCDYDDDDGVPIVEIVRQCIAQTIGKGEA